MHPQVYVRYNVHTMHKTVSATQARKQLFQLLKIASKPGSSVTITLEGNPPIVMLSQDEFEGWMETMEIMSDPQLMKDIQEAAKETEFIEWSVLKKKLRL